MFADRTNWNLSPNRLSEALVRRRAAGLEIIDLTISNPTECGFAYDERAILSALSNPAALRYQPKPLGLESAREAVARYYQGRGVAVPIEDIVLTTSTSEAYSYVFRTICNPGDELLIPEPSYPLFDFLAEIQDVKLVRYPLVYDHGWQVDFHGLEQAITTRTRGVIVVHPNNPTGHFCKRAEMTRLSEICVARQLAIIADEVFLDFAITGDAQATFAGNSEALTFTLSGISKICGLPQMKLAWVAMSGPPRSKQLAASRLEVIADTYLSVSTPVQLALPVFLEQGDIVQSQILDRVKANLGQLDRLLAAQSLCARLQLEGGWHACVRVPARGSDEDLAVDLLEKAGVYVYPGRFFDFGVDGNLVLSLIGPEVAFREGVSRILSVFANS